MRPRSCRTSPTLRFSSEQQQKSQQQLQLGLQHQSFSQFSSSGSGSSGSSSSLLVFPPQSGGATSPHSTWSHSLATRGGGCSDRGDFTSGVHTQANLREFVRKTSSALTNLNAQVGPSALLIGLIVLLELRVYHANVGSAFIDESFHQLENKNCWSTFSFSHFG